MYTQPALWDGNDLPPVRGTEVWQQVSGDVHAAEYGGTFMCHTIGYDWVKVVEVVNMAEYGGKGYTVSDYEFTPRDLLSLDAIYTRMLKDLPPTATQEDKYLALFDYGMQDAIQGDFPTFKQAMQSSGIPQSALWDTAQYDWVEDSEDNE